MGNRIFAPFTPAQVVALTKYQAAGFLHPFTCGGEGRTDKSIHGDGEGVLVATVRGWICPWCDYVQNWALAMMADPQALQAFERALATTTDSIRSFIPSQSPRTCVGTCKKIIEIVPETEPLHAELKAFIDGIFLELPENNYRLWVEAAVILNKHIADADESAGWKKEACAIWFLGSWEGARWAISVDREDGSEQQPRSGTVTVEHVIDFLNGALALDAEAITALVEQRVRCNKALGDHPTIQVGWFPKDGSPQESGKQYVDDGTNELRVGLLGLLNGLFGVDERGWGYIAAVYPDAGSGFRFKASES